MAPSSFLEQIAALPGDRPAVTDPEGVTASLAEVRRAADRVARHLRALGLRGQREPVGILVERRPAWLAAYLGVLAAGGITVPLSDAYPPAELARLLSDSGGRHIIISERYRPVAGQLGVEPLGIELLMSQPPAEPVRAAALPQADDVAMLLYTSGTTGRPKGAVITHQNLAAQTGAIAAAWGLGPGDVLLHALPLHHMHGVGISLLPSLVAGGTTRFLDRFEARQAWEALSYATVLMAVPTMYFKLLDVFDAADRATRQRWQAAARALRLATSGSAPLAATLAERWRAIAGAIPLERYGMTEIGVGFTNPLEPSERRVGCVGRVLKPLELRLVTAEGAEAGAQDGEIWLRGEGVFRGYWRNPEATAAAFTGGWFRTGDTAVREADGTVRILGRTSVDILKSGGYKLSALEIEEALRQHPAIAEVAVVGLADEQWGQLVAAAVIPKAGCEDACRDGAALRSWAKERLAPYKVPRRFEMVAELPRNALGKVLKGAVLAQLSRSAGDPGRQSRG